MAKQYLDATGLSHYDEKIKSYISSKLNNKQNKINSSTDLDVRTIKFYGNSGSDGIRYDMITEGGYFSLPAYTGGPYTLLTSSDVLVTAGNGINISGNKISIGDIEGGLSFVSGNAVATIIGPYYTSGSYYINLPQGGGTMALTSDIDSKTTALTKDINSKLAGKQNLITTGTDLSVNSLWAKSNVSTVGSVYVWDVIKATGTIQSDRALVAPCIKEADFYIQSAYNDDGSTGTRYTFPRVSPVMGFGTGGGTGIVPVIGELENAPSAGYLGLYIPSRDGYDNSSYDIISPAYSNTGNNVYKLPYLDTHEAFLLTDQNIQAGSNITITKMGNTGITISSSGGGGTSYTAGTNIVITGTTIKTSDAPTFATSVTTPLIKNDSSKITLLPAAIVITAPSGTTFSNSSVTFTSGAYFNSGATFNYAKGITFMTGGKGLGTLTPNSGASGNPTIYLPSSGGTIALKSDIPASVAGVSSIDGVRGAITLGTGLSMSDNVLSASGGGGTITLYNHRVLGYRTDNCDVYIEIRVINTSEESIDSSDENLLTMAASITVFEVDQNGNTLYVTSGLRNGSSILYEDKSAEVVSVSVNTITFDMDEVTLI